MNEPYVRIKITQKHVHLSWSIRVLSKKHASGKLSCFIPDLNIAFAANNENLEDKTKAFSKKYFDHYLEHHSKSGLKRLTLDLHKKGFKSNNNADDIHKLINNVVVNAKFKPTKDQIPSEFSNAQEHFETNHMEVAV